MEVLVDGKEVKYSGDSHVEQGYVVIVAPDELEPGLLVNIHSWTTATGSLLLKISGFEILFNYFCVFYVLRHSVAFLLLLFS